MLLWVVGGQFGKGVPPWMSTVCVCVLVNTMRFELGKLVNRNPKNVNGVTSTRSGELSTQMGLQCEVSAFVVIPSQSQRITSIREISMESLSRIIALARVNLFENRIVVLSEMEPVKGCFNLHVTNRSMLVSLFRDLKELPSYLSRFGTIGRRRINIFIKRNLKKNYRDYFFVKQFIKTILKIEMNNLFRNYNLKLI